MQLIVSRKPCLLLEAAELVFAQFNHIPAETVVIPGEYCIPAEEVERIQSQICALLPMNGKQVSFYFRAFHTEDHPSSPTCLSFCLLYISLAPNCPEVDDYLDQSLQWWAVQGNNYHISGMIDHFSFASIEDGETAEFRSLAQEMQKLSVPVETKMELVEVLSNFPYHIRKVAELLRPAVERLRELLDPWVQRAQPRLDQWETFFREGNLLAYLAKFSQLANQEIRRCTIGLLYFHQGGGPGQFLLDGSRVSLMFSPDVPPTLADFVRPKDEKLQDTQFNALRLLSNPTRMEMLRLMADHAMSPPELMAALKLHAGSVYRDLDGLLNARLITMEVCNGPPRYRTNPVTIRKLTSQLMAYLKV